MPWRRLCGAPVFAGSINQIGCVVKSRTERIGRIPATGGAKRIIEAGRASRAYHAPSAKRLAESVGGHTWSYFALGAADDLPVDPISRQPFQSHVAGAFCVLRRARRCNSGVNRRSCRGVLVKKGGLFLEQLGKSGYRGSG